MSGTLILKKQDGEQVNFRRYEKPTNLNNIKKIWKITYGKAFDKLVLEDIPDQVPDKKSKSYSGEQVKYGKIYRRVSTGRRLIFD